MGAGTIGFTLGAIYDSLCCCFTSSASKSTFSLLEIVAKLFLAFLVLSLIAGGIAGEFCLNFTLQFYLNISDIVLEAGKDNKTATTSASTTTTTSSSSTPTSAITELVKGSLARIEVKTLNCTGCSPGDKEQGLQLHLTGPGSVECTTGNLDNEDVHDYDFYSVSQFKSTIVGGSDSQVLGECDNVRDCLSLIP